MVSLASLWKELQNHSAESDAECLVRFRTSRDPHAFTILVNRYSGLVRSVCRRQLRSVADIDDAYQTTFAALALKPHLVRDGAALPGWLHTTAWRVAVRIRQRQPLAELPDLPAKPNADASLQQGLAALDDCLQKLPEKLRRPLVVCYLQEQTQEDAARILGLSVSTLRRRLEAGRGRLKTLLEAQGIELGAILTLSAATTATSQAGPSAAAILAFSTTLPNHLKPVLQGVMMTLLLEKVRLVILVVGLGGIAATGTGLVAVTATAQGPSVGPGMTPGPMLKSRLDAKDAAEELDYQIELTKLQIETAKVAMQYYPRIQELARKGVIGEPDIGVALEKHLKAKQDLMIAERKLALLNKQKGTPTTEAPTLPIATLKPARDPELQKLLQLRMKAYELALVQIQSRENLSAGNTDYEPHLRLLKSWRDALLELNNTPDGTADAHRKYSARVKELATVVEKRVKAGQDREDAKSIFAAELLEIAVQEKKAQLEGK